MGLSVAELRFKPKLFNGKAWPLPLCHTAIVNWAPVWGPESFFVNFSPFPPPLYRLLILRHPIQKSIDTVRNGAPTNTSKIGEAIYTRPPLEGCQGTGCNRFLPHPFGTPVPKWSLVVRCQAKVYTIRLFLMPWCHLVAMPKNRDLGRGRIVSLKGEWCYWFLWLKDSQHSCSYLTRTLLGELNFLKL